jgi:serine/threonine-protein kinase
MNMPASGRYQILGLLGEGSFGQVFLATDPALGRRVAIKMLRSQFTGDQSFMARFQSEAASLAALNHLNVTLIYDILVSGEQHGMVMELVHGHTLEYVLINRKKLQLAETMAVAAQAVAGLAYVHKRGVVHRDIKPSNIMLTMEGILKVMDFGIARVDGSKRLTRDGSMMGTLNYASPEQIKRGEAEQRSDLYSLGCIVYEMISGSPPFDGRSEYELMQAHIAETPEPLSRRLPELPVVVDRAVLRALAKNPDDRFATVEEFGQALGIEAIRSKAVETVHKIVESVGAPPMLLAEAGSVGGRVVADAPAPRSQDHAPSKPAGVGRKRALPGRVSTPAVRESAPLLAMGGAVVVALAVLGFILLDSTTGGPVQTASIGNDPSTSSSSQKEKTNTSSSLPTDISQKLVEKPPSPPPPPPPETPAFKGRVVDWIGGSAILVPDESGKGARVMKLHGVRDLMGTQHQANEIRRELNGYLDSKGREVTCYKRSTGHDQNPPEYQCFLDKQDIARWALERRLAVAAPDAPKEYRAASQ